jgi:hypothetical protein
VDGQPHLGGPALIAMGFAFLPTPGPGFTEIHVAAFAQQRSRFECPGFDSCPAARQLSEGVPHRAGGLVAHRGQGVGVGVEGHGYGGVSEELLHDLGVDAAA